MTDLTEQLKALLEGSPAGHLHIICDCDEPCEHDDQNRNLLRLKNLAPQMAEAHLAMSKRLEAAEKLADRFVAVMSMIETEISSEETWNAHISAIVRRELDVIEAADLAAFRGEGE